MTPDAPTRLKILDDTLMDQVRDRARLSPRSRAIHRFHEHQERVQRMVNCIEPESYVRPHKHEDPDKVEMFIVLRGRAAVVEFHDDGAPAAVTLIAARGGARGVEIPPRTWHMLVSLESGTTLFELSEGPYEETSHKRWAPWAPDEASPEGAAYLASLKRTLGI